MNQTTRPSYIFITKICFLFVSLWLSATTVKAKSTSSLFPNDVSILLPLPESVYHSQLLRPNTTGRLGALLPSEFQNLLPSLFPAYQQDVLLSALRVVGIRIDPCFPNGPTPADGCTPQIRLVWQPLLATRVNLIVVDAAVHTFYPLSAEDLEFVQTVLRQLKKTQGPEGGSPTLQIHPTLRLQGYDSPYWEGLRNLVLHLCGKNNLSRVTFMTTVAVDAMWDFGGFDIGQSGTRRIPIALIKTMQQSFINRDESGIGFRGGIRPRPLDTTEAKAYDLITGNSWARASEIDTLQRALDLSDQMENPILRNPNNTDCVSCHTAAAVRNVVLKNTDHLFERKYLYSRTPGPTENISANTINLRAFGYFGNQPVISLRVVNETNEILNTFHSIKRMGESATF